MDIFDLPPGVKRKAQRGPYAVDLEANWTYYFCTCGRSARQPFCDGMHMGSGFSPKPFTVEETGKYQLCGCKHTKNEPFCDGEHDRIEW